MKITFLLSGACPRPSGGSKVVYEYANALTALGHEVTVAHAAYMPEAGFDCAMIMRNLLLRYPINKALGRWRPKRWFAVDRRVRMLWIPSLHARFVPDADAIVATWWHTAEILASWPNRKGRKHYLIQHLETWGGPEHRVLNTWRLPLSKIVIARWLEEIAVNLGEHCHYIPNGLDFESFGIDMNPASRSPFSAAMLYHEFNWKGSSDGIAALLLAKSVLPQLRAELFGVSRAPANLPEWIRYHRNPQQSELRALYSRSAIFVAPSWTEGWPLPPAEALMSGCALACTDIGGHREYAIDGVTALMSPPRNPDALADNIVRLATDTDLRIKLAMQGNQFMRRFTWQRAATRMEAVLAMGAASAMSRADGSTPGSGTVPTAAGCYEK